MEIRNESYQTYINVLVQSIPDADLTSLITEFATTAIFLMGDKIKDEDLKNIIRSIIYVLKTYYSFIPLHLVAEAFGKGSIGNLGGTTKFNARNVNIWMTAIQEKFNNLTAQERNREENNTRANFERIFLQNQAHNVRFGTALSLKLSWVYEGRIKADDWEKYTLDNIVEKLKAGYKVNELKPSQIYETLSHV